MATIHISFISISALARSVIILACIIRAVRSEDFIILARLSPLTSYFSAASFR